MLGAQITLSQDIDRAGLKVPPYMATFSGTLVDLIDPDPQTIHIADIAHHLSQIPRWTGATRETYSVAQHSVMVAYQAPAHLKLAAILHEVGEYVTGDVSTPLKQICPGIRLVEDRIQKAAGIRFGIDPALFDCPELKVIDYRMCRTEKDQFLANPDADWWGFVNRYDAYDIHLHPMSQQDAKDLFLMAFWGIWGRRT